MKRTTRNMNTSKVDKHQHFLTIRDVITSHKQQQFYFFEKSLHSYKLQWFFLFAKYDPAQTKNLIGFIKYI